MIKKVKMENIYVNFAADAKAGDADMLCFVEPMCKNRFYFNVYAFIKMKDFDIKKYFMKMIKKFKKIYCIMKKKVLS